MIHRHRITPFALVVGLLLSYTACITPKPPQAPESKKTTATTANTPLSKNSPELLDSSIDIQYVLGHDHYRFFAAAEGNTIVGNTALNKQILEKGTMSQNRYPDYFKKVSHFIHEMKKLTSDDLESCRTPFTIIVKVGQNTQTAHGCRSTDGGALSRLVRDGEFLLYSKN